MMEDEAPPPPLYPHPSPNGWPFPTWLPYKYNPGSEDPPPIEDAPF